MFDRSSSSIKTAFFIRVLPLFFLTSVCFLIALANYELERAKKDHRNDLQKTTHHIAELLREPLWQLSERLYTEILSAALNRSEIVCVRLIQEANVSPPVERGECQNQYHDQESFSTEIYYDLGGKKAFLGSLIIQARVSDGWATIKRQLYILASLSVVLFILLAGATLAAFNSAILPPLRHISASLKQLQDTGQRQPVNWSSPDELGDLIRVYNGALRHQTIIEDKLEAARQEAEQALENLQHAQESLIQAEKMASLGSLVAGVAHEINTPLGNSLTITTTIGSSAERISTKVANQALTRHDLNTFISDISEASAILERNLQNAATLVRSFKQAAVDQTSEKQRNFNLKRLVEDVLYTLQPQVKRTGFTFQVEIDDDLWLTSYPGAIGQIITNCVYNSLRHGFQDRDHGIIRFATIDADTRHVVFTISDDGCGMSPDVLHHAFDPFFTTKFGQGGSGLGLNLVYNLTTTVLGGTVKIWSEENNGVTLSFTFPYTPHAEAKG